MGTLANKIDSLPTQCRHLEDWSNTRTAWLAGFDTGLYEAANLAKEADELMSLSVQALREAIEEIESLNPDSYKLPAFKMTLSKMEQNQ